MMSETIPKIIIICGPTASGKSELGVRLAQELDGEIVNADSMQIYRRMDIGTAKPTIAERGGIPHHLIDVVDPEQTFSAADYADAARKSIDEIVARGKLPIVVGGTGLYIRALLYGLVDSPAPLITSVVWLPKPINTGAKETTVAPLRIVPVENGINPPP